jgi:hypothetical protein
MIDEPSSEGDETGDYTSEYDVPESEVVSQLDEIADMSDELYAAIDENDNVDEIPDWVKEKVSIAYANLTEVYSSYEDEENDKAAEENSEEGQTSSDSEGEVIMTSESVQLLSEEIDDSKFKQLVRLGLSDNESVSRIITIMKKIDGGKVLTSGEAMIVGDMFQTLIGIVTGDTTVFNKVKTAVSASAKTPSTSE